MLKFTGSGPGGTTYFLGLSRGNVDRLTAGQPIAVNLAEMGGPDLRVVILFGETEQKLFEDLQAGGLIPPEVEYREAEVGTAEVTRVRRRADQAGELAPDDEAMLRELEQSDGAFIDKAVDECWGDAGKE